MKFDAPSSYIQVGDHPELKLGADENLTLTFWIYIPEEDKNEQMRIVSHGSSADNAGGGYAIHYRGDQPLRYMNFIAKDGENNLQWESFAFNVPTDTWHHVVVVVDRDTGKVRCYFNGELVKEVNNNLTAAADGKSTPFRIGWLNTTFDVRGMVDDVRVYK